MSDLNTVKNMTDKDQSVPLGGQFGEDAPYPCFILHQESHKIIWANDAAMNWSGLSLRKLGLSAFWTMIEVRPDPEAKIRHTIASDSAVTIRECEIILPHQSPDHVHLCQLSAFPTQGHIGVSLRFVKAPLSNVNIGGHLVTGMGRLIAHELKNPLAGIKGAAQLLRDDVDTEEGQGLIDLIASEIDRIRRLADRMETLGDVDPETEEQVNIHEILRRARQIIQSANADVEFEEIYDPSLPHAAGDTDTLMQAVLNLIKNAAEAGRKITLKTRFRSGISVKTNGQKSNDNLPIEIQVIDDGPGIAPDMLEEIFQPFVSTKAHGQGLGLALVSKVAASHGGLVQVRSIPGRTKFSLLLPSPKSGRLNTSTLSSATKDEQDK